jgi:hypothetical protein
LRKLRIFLVLSILISGCGATKQPIAVDPCDEIKDLEKRVLAELPSVDEVGRTQAKVEVLKWAFIVTGDPQCFSTEYVATAKSTIALVG